MTTPHGGAGFPSTHWSLVARAGQDPTEAKRQALGDLLIRYLPALRAHLVYGKHRSPEDADDILQEFIADKIIEKQLIGRAGAELGKFRTFLLTSLDHFLIDHWRAESARKRAPAEGQAQMLGDRVDQLPADEQRDAFDLSWAHHVIAETVRRMRAECEAAGREDLWGVFECRLVDPLLYGAEPVEYDVLIARFRLESPSQASNLLITAKRMFNRLIRTVVGEYAVNADEVETEICDLMEVLARVKK